MFEVDKKNEFPIGGVSPISGAAICEDIPPRAYRGAASGSE